MRIASREYFLPRYCLRLGRRRRCTLDGPRSRRRRDAWAHDRGITLIPSQSPSPPPIDPLPLPTHNLSSVVREAEWLSGRPAGHGWMDGLDGPTHEKWAIFHLEMNKRQKNIDPSFVREWNHLRVGGSGEEKGRWGLKLWKSDTWTMAICTSRFSCSAERVQPLISICLQQHLSQQSAPHSSPCPLMERYNRCQIDGPLPPAPPPSPPSVPPPFFALLFFPGCVELETRE